MFYIGPIPKLAPSPALVQTRFQIAEINLASAPRWPRLSLGMKGAAVANLQMALAQLGYLPIAYGRKISPLTPSGVRQAPAASWHWHWQYQTTPATLKALWSRNQYSVVTEGAVMQFQYQNGLTMTGMATPKLFDRISYDMTHNLRNRQGYSYVLVQKHIPETLTLWFDGSTVTSLTNTGIPQSPTPDGTTPVYLRYLSQDMSGVNPWGVPYNDPGVPYVSYFNGGDAIHGFVRAAYGFPQSLGCVELPVQAARIAWNYIHYGTLVTVIN